MIILSNGEQGGKSGWQITSRRKRLFSKDGDIFHFRFNVRIKYKKAAEELLL